MTVDGRNADFITAEYRGTLVGACDARVFAKVRRMVKVGEILKETRFTILV